MAIMKKTALVYCGNLLDLVDKKTPARWIRQSDIYTIVGIIDTSLAGKYSGEVLGDKNNNIPIFANLHEALSKLSEIPNCYIYAKAPLDDYISTEDRSLILEAMEKGMDIINGFHQFFSED